MTLPRPSGEIRTSYESEESLFYTRRFKYASGVLALALIALPFFLGRYPRSIYQNVLIFYISALGLIVLTGYAGQISVGHGAVMGVGAYTVGIVAGRIELPFVLTILVGGLVAGAFGALVGLTARRLKGWYLLISTLAFQVIFVVAIETFRGVTRGAHGLQIPDPTILGASLMGAPFAFVLAVTALLATLLVANVRRSHLGRAFQAIGHRDIVAEILGVNLTVYKVYAFALAFFLGGIAGGFYSYSLGVVAPEEFNLFVSIELIGIILVGGLERIKGAALGALMFVLVPEVLIVFAIEYGVPVGPLVKFVFALIVIGFLLYEPKGLAKIWEDTKEYIRAWPYRNF